MKYVKYEGEIYIRGRDVATWLDTASKDAFEQQVLPTAGIWLRNLANILRKWILDTTK